VNENGSARRIQRLAWESGVTRCTSDRVEDVEGELQARGFTLLPGATDLLRCYIQSSETPWFALWIRLHTIEYVLDLPDQRAFEAWMKAYYPILPILDRIFGRL
jgi:hypothetical protein